MEAVGGNPVIEIASMPKIARRLGDRDGRGGTRTDNTRGTTIAGSLKRASRIENDIMTEMADLGAGLAKTNIAGETTGTTVEPRIENMSLSGANSRTERRGRRKDSGTRIP
jgi:hypothetical protein